MERKCVRCGKTFTAKRSTARFCGKDCSTRACLERQTGARVRVTAADPAGKPLLFDAALEEFERLGVSLSVAACQALGCAKLLDAASTADSSRASLSKEFSRLRVDALAGVPTPGDPVDELRRRYRAKRGLLDPLEAQYLS